jgi:hypothetical protein
MTKSMLFLATVLALGVFGTSLARANGDGDAQGLGRSFDIGPSGQVFGAPPAPTRAYSSGFGASEFAYVPPVQEHRHAPKHNHSR